MNLFKGKHFSTLYLKILSKFLSSSLGFVQSRLGLVKDLGPSVLELYPDGNRFCLLDKRGINPFFALYEMSWLASGSNHVEGLKYFIKTFAQYSDDGISLNGAYGYRIRKYFGIDQLEKAIDLLKHDNTSRRVCIAIWSVDDLGKESKDIPCNIYVIVKIRDGRLDLSVGNRSNDVFLGVPYDVLLFSFIQNFIAKKLNLRCGKQVHFIDSLHLYKANLPAVKEILKTNKTNKIIHLIRKTKRTNLTDYVELDHEKIVRNYDRFIFEDNPILIIRNCYFLWKKGQHENAIKSLPPTELGLCAIFWFMRLKEFNRKFLPNWFLEMDV